MTYKVVILCSQKIYNLGAQGIQDKNSYDIDDQWIRQSQKGQLQNNIETAKTEIHTDLKSRTMADLRCAKGKGVWAYSSPNALIRNLNSPLGPGGQRPNPGHHLFLWLSFLGMQPGPFTDRYLRLLSCYRGRFESWHRLPDPWSSKHYFQKSAEFWHVVDGEPLKCFSRGLSSGLSLTHSAHCENEHEKVRPEVGN